jgi:hypothetical protein
VPEQVIDVVVGTGGAGGAGGNAYTTTVPGGTNTGGDGGTSGDGTAGTPGTNGGTTTVSIGGTAVVSAVGGFGGGQTGGGMIGVTANGGVGGGGSGGVTGAALNNITISSTQVNFKFKIDGESAKTVVLTPGTYTPAVIFATLVAAMTTASGYAFSFEIQDFLAWITCVADWYLQPVSNCAFSIFDELETEDVSSHTNLILLGAYSIGQFNLDFNYNHYIVGTVWPFGPQECRFRLLSDEFESHGGNGGIGGTGSNGGAGHNGGDGGDGGEGGNAGESRYFGDAGSGTDDSLGGKGGFGKVLNEGTNGEDGTNGVGGDVGNVLRTEDYWTLTPGTRGYNYSVNGHIYGGGPGSGGEGGTNTILFERDGVLLKTYGNGGNGGNGGRGAAGATGLSAVDNWDVQVKAGDDYTPADSVTTTPHAGSAGVSGTDGCVIIEWDVREEVADTPSSSSAPSAARRRMRF